MTSAPPRVTRHDAEARRAGEAAIRPGRHVEAPSGVRIPAPSSGAAIRLLVAADHMLVRAGLRSVLDHVPDIAVVAEAASGDEAVALAHETKPDVVVLDIDMPRAGGLAATRTMTARDPHPAVLALTMTPEDEGLVDALRAGVSGYVTKNVERQELMTAVRSCAMGDMYVRPNAGSLLAATFHRPTPPPADATRVQFDGLSLREQTVLRLVAEGHTGPEIGRVLGITAKTVDTYRHRIQEKIGLSHRADYIRFALQLGLLSR